MTLALNDLRDALNGLLSPGPTASLQVPTESLPGTEGSAPAPTADACCQIVDAKTRGYHLDVKANPTQVLAVAGLLNEQGFAMDTVTGVDWIAAGEMEIVTDFFDLHRALHVVVRTRVPRDNPEVPSMSGIFAGANWHEREAHEFFGIRFSGHPNLTPLLLPEDSTYHPLRKDFTGVT